LSAPSLVLQPQEALSRSAEPPGQAIKPKRAQIGAACIVCQRAKTKVSHVHLQAHRKNNIIFSYWPSDTSKCDGVRPSCKRCTKRKTACIHALTPVTKDLESIATTESTLKVQAQPWTSVADSALVSELLSSFFVYDNCFYLSFVDQESFLHDLQTGDTESADFCSPLLVNAICALRCVSIFTDSWDIAK
jgi:hypothetical protein